MAFWFIKEQIDGDSIIVGNNPYKIMMLNDIKFDENIDFSISNKEQDNKKLMQIYVDKILKIDEENIYCNNKISIIWI